jgi:hypothetical protein
MKVKELFEHEAIPKLKQNHMIELTLEFSGLTDLCKKMKANLQQFKKLINEKTGTDSIILVSTISFSIKLLIEDKNVDAFDNYRENVLDVLNEFAGDSSNYRENHEDHHVNLFFSHEVPKLSIPISYDTVYVNVENKSSLSGIDKIISSFRNLYIRNCENVTGKALGIIRLAKKGKAINLSTSDYHELHWMYVINKHLNPERQNVVACQRELIERDLDEYAEF